VVTNKHLMQTSEYSDKIVTEKWLSEQFLSLVWIGLFLFVIFTYILFFYLADKKRLVEILLFGSLVAVAFSVYDSIGELIGLWSTFFRMVSLQQNFFMSDLTIIPLFAMLIYQYSNSWKIFFMATVIWADRIAFVFYYIILNRLNVFVYLTPYTRVSIVHQSGDGAVNKIKPAPRNTVWENFRLSCSLKKILEISYDKSSSKSRFLRPTSRRAG